jgi:hypothetical protein
LPSKLCKVHIGVVGSTGLRAGEESLRTNPQSGGLMKSKLVPAIANTGFRRFECGPLAVALAAMLSPPAHALTVTVRSPLVYSSNTAAMETALGIAGKTIEDFEDTTLISGLGIDYTLPGGTTSISALPQVYTPGACGFTWGGVRALVNTPQNNCWDATGQANIASLVTFHVGSASFFGIGLSNFQPGLVDHGLLVNGVQVGVLESYANFALYNQSVGRNGYLIIQAGAGESIQSVGFQLLANTGGGTFMGTPNQSRPIDGLIFDHLAIDRIEADVPLPAAAWLLLSGMVGLGAVGRRKAS